MANWVIWGSRLVLLWLAIVFTPLGAILNHVGSPILREMPSLGSAPALWVVEDADSRIYLFGTIHLLRPETEWFKSKVVGALNESDALWTETQVVEDPDDMQRILETFGKEPSGSLTKRLSAADRQKLVLAAYQLGIPMEQLDQMRPWLASMVIEGVALNRGGYRQEAGVETVLERAAQLRRLPVRELESSEQHVRFLSDLPAPVEEEMLHQTLNPQYGSLDRLDDMSTDWSRGKVGRLDEDMAQMKVQAPQLYEALIQRRNANWALQIHSLMQGSGVHFIAVGAGHLAGPDSLQSKLEARGLEVKRR